MGLLQTFRSIEITTPLGDDVLLPYRMRAEEELGRLFAFELELLSKDSGIKFEDILGQNVSIRLKLADGNERHFNGIVSRFEQSGSLDEYYTYKAVVSPWLWFLTRTADCRIFQAKKVPEIVKEVFRDHGFTDFEESLSGSYRTWEYCVQYRETDFNFVSRLMEQEGIYYYFRHEKGKHTLVMADSVSAHAPFPGYEKIAYYPPDDTLRREQDHIFGWTLSREIQPGVYALDEFDFTRPKANLEVKAAIAREHAQAGLEIFDYPGEYEQSADGETYARIRIEAFQARYEQIRAKGNARGLAAGCLFELTQYPREDQNREYLIVRAAHLLETDGFKSGAPSSESTQVYTCDFTALESKQPFRPADITPKPIVRGPQTAIVVGPAGRELFTDNYGRVKIQFHWDRYGKSDENSSGWVRVSHPNAGKGYGSVAVPRIGQEVIVDFLEGDPDRPIITGRVYNAGQMPAYGFPAAAMVSGTKSNSTPGGGGYNEMSMNDTKGQELMTLHAQRDMNTTVGNDHTLAVKNNRSLSVDADDTTQVKGKQTIGVDGDQQLTIKGKSEKNVDGDNSITVKGKQDKTIQGDKIVTVVGKGAETFQSDKETTILGSRKKTVEGSETVIINAGRTKTISSGETVTINGPTTHTINADFTRITTGNYTIDAPNINNIGTRKVAFTCAGSNITLTSGKITISSEGSTIEISGGGVSINGKKISLN